MRSFILGFAISFMSFASVGFADEVRNGADLPSFWTDSAWFLGVDDVVHYCIESAADFGVSIDFAKTQFTEALQTWNSYVSEKSVWRSAHAHRSASRYELLDTCNGTEDLKLKLGIRDNEVAAAQAALSLQNPVGFAYRSSFDRRRSWSKGFIWVASQGSIPMGEGSVPDWNAEDTLKGVFLHEIGHVLGNTHAKGTIMDEMLANYVVLKSMGRLPYRRSVFSSIDWNRELFPSFEYFAQKGRLTENVGDVPGEQRNFAFLVGRSSNGDIRSQMVLEKSDDQFLGSLKLEDDVGMSTVSFTLEKSSLISSIGAQVFVSYYETQDWTSRGINFQIGTVLFGTMTLANGQTKSIVVERNMNERIAALSILDGGTKTTIFRTNNPQE